MTAFIRGSAPRQVAAYTALQCAQVPEISITGVFGVKPAADSSTAKVYPGTGAPNFEGYDATEHKAACK